MDVFWSWDDPSLALPAEVVGLSLAQRPVHHRGKPGWGFGDALSVACASREERVD